MTETKNCPYCGEEIKAKAIKCRYCQSTLSPVTKICENNECQAEIDFDIWTCPHCRYVQHAGEQEEGMLTAGWIIGTILLPIIGLVGSIYGLVKKRKGAWGLLGITIVAWILGIIIVLYMFYNGFFNVLSSSTTSVIPEDQVELPQDDLPPWFVSDESVPEAWVKIATWKGEGIKSTETFITQTREWKIYWNTYDETFEGAGILQIYVYDANNDIPISIVANVQGPSKDSSYVRTPPGDYYLEINSGNIKWEVSVEEIR